MIQTVTQNSALSQNWVECLVHTPMAQAGHPLRPGRARSAVSECALGRVAALCRVGTHVVSSPPKVTIQKLYRNPNLCCTHCAPFRMHYCVYRSTPGRIVERWASYSSRVMRRVATQGWPSAMIHIASHP